MMPGNELMYIGPVPCDEKCEQLGPTYRPEVAKAECRAFINQLKRMHGEPPDGARVRINAAPHDFGTYHEVVVEYDPKTEAAVAYALKLEAESPNQWDEDALEELARTLSPKPFIFTFGSVLDHNRNR